MKSPSFSRAVWCAAAFLLLFSLFPAFFLRHHDLGWHLRAGELIWNRQAIPATDPWSFTAGGYPWLNIAWLADLLLWLLYRCGGLSLLVLISLLSAAALTGMQAVLARRMGAGASATFAALLWSACCLLTYEAPDNPLAVSPQAATLLLLLIENVILFGSALSFRSRCLAAALIQLLWSNLHGGFPAGLFTFGLFLIFERKRFISNGALPPLLSLLTFASPFMTPLGPSIIEAIRRTLDHPSMRYITEWGPFSATASPLTAFYLLMFVLSLPTIRRARGFAPLAIQSAVWLCAGLSQQRSLSLFLALSPPLVALGLTPIMERLLTRYNRFALPIDRTPRAALAALLGVLGLAPFFIARGGGDDWPAAMDPKAEIAFLRTHHRGERVFNEWNFGAFLIFHAPLELPIYIDGRAGTAYPPELFQEYEKEYLAPDADWDALFERRKLRVALVALYRTRAMHFFETNRCWKKEFQGEAGAVFSRSERCSAPRQP